MRLDEIIVIVDGKRILYASRLNRIENARDRVDEIVEWVESIETVYAVILDDAPASQEFGRLVSQAIVSNRHIQKICLVTPSPGTVIQDMRQDVLPWISGWGTLQIMNRFPLVTFTVRTNDMSVQDCDSLFQSLLTCTSICNLAVRFRQDGCNDVFMSALARYIASSSLRKLSLYGNLTMSETAFVSFCDGIAQNSRLFLKMDGCRVAGETNLVITAECLARAIVESSLLFVEMDSEMHFALSHTAPVKDLDFAFSPSVDTPNRMVINRNWKPLLSANIPLGLWPHILAKSHVSPEFSHGLEGILFYLLKEKADLIPTISPRRKRKRED